MNREPVAVCLKFFLSVRMRSYVAGSRRRLGFKFGGKYGIARGGMENYCDISANDLSNVLVGAFSRRK